MFIKISLSKDLQKPLRHGFQIKILLEYVCQLSNTNCRKTTQIAERQHKLQKNNTNCRKTTQIAEKTTQIAERQQGQVFIWNKKGLKRSFKHLTLSQTSPGFYMSAVQVF